VYLLDALIEPAGIMGALIVFGLLMLVSLVISLYAIFGKIRPGIRRLSQIDGGFRICYTGATLMIAGLLIVVSGLVVAAITGAVEERPAIAALGGSMLAFGVIIIGGIISLIGYIFTFVLGAFRLHSRYKNSLYMAAGILFVVDTLDVPRVGRSPHGIRRVGQNPRGRGLCPDVHGPRRHDKQAKHCNHNPGAGLTPTDA
jgi:hypothetical protein